MRTQSRLLTALTGVTIAGCGGVPSHPIRSSLVDITGESRSISVPSGWPLVGPIAEHRQATSIAGLLQVPDIGQEFQFSGGNDVSTAVGVAVLQSYRLVAESDILDGPEKVQAVRAALERSQSLALDASLLTIEIAKLQASILKAETSEQEPLRRRRDTLLARRDEKELALASASDQLRDAANHPGIVIAKWDARSDGGAGIEAGPGYVGAMASEARSGFVILGGLRVVTVVFGEDFWWLLNNLRPHEKDHIDQIGVTTHLLQARDVAYTSSLDVAATAALTLQADAVGLDLLEQARLSAYWSFAGQYRNSGSLPRVKWRREPFCFACSLDLPEMAEPEDRALSNAFDVAKDAYREPDFDGWRTVTATVTYLRDVPLFFGWKNHAAQYGEPRSMCSSPACRLCSAQPRVEVPGR